jgi:hypothetical protein
MYHYRILFLKNYLYQEIYDGSEFTGSLPIALPKKDANVLLMTNESVIIMIDE